MLSNVRERRPSCDNNATINVGTCNNGSTSSKVSLGSRENSRATATAPIEVSTTETKHLTERFIENPSKNFNTVELLRIIELKKWHSYIKFTVDNGQIKLDQESLLTDNRLSKLTIRSINEFVELLKLVLIDNTKFELDLTTPRPGELSLRPTINKFIRVLNEGQSPFLKYIESIKFGDIYKGDEKNIQSLLYTLSGNAGIWFPDMPQREYLLTGLRRLIFNNIENNVILHIPSYPNVEKLVFDGIYGNLLLGDFCNLFPHEFENLKELSYKCVKQDSVLQLFEKLYNERGIQGTTVI